MSAQMRENCSDLEREVERRLLKQPSDSKKGDARKEVLQVDVEYEGGATLTVSLCIGHDASLLDKPVHAGALRGCKLAEEL